MKDIIKIKKIKPFRLRVLFVLLLVFALIENCIKCVNGTHSDVEQSRRTQLVQHFPTPTNDSTIQQQQKQLVFVAMFPSRETNETKAKKDCTILKALPALELAIKNVQQMHFAHNTLLNITLISRDTFCSSICGPIGMFEIYTKWRHLDAIFGLPCEYVLAPISRYSSVWQIPVITTGGLASEFDKKADSFTTLTRVRGSPVTYYGQVLHTFAEVYNWTRMAMIVENNNQQSRGNSVCYFCGMAVVSKLQKMAVYSQTFDSTKWTKQNITYMLTQISKVARVVIMCGDPGTIRQIMLTAEELNMIDSGEYVFINIELYSPSPHLLSQPWFDKNDSKENNERAKKAYTAMLTITSKQPDDPEHRRLTNEIKSLAAAKYNYTFHDNEPVSTFVTSFYDGVILYALALNESLQEDPTLLTRPLNGTDMVRRMWNRSFKGISGNVTIDANGDRISDFSLLDMNPTNGRFEIVAYFTQNGLKYLPGKKIHWAGGRQEPPPDRPTCGYDGSLCPALPGYAILSIVLGIMVVVLLVGFFFGYRYYKAEADLNAMSWKVSIDDVMCPNIGGHGLRGSFHSLVKYNSQITLMSDDMNSIGGGDRQMFIPVGVYRGCKVAIKPINEHNVNLNRSLMLELKHMKDLTHDHLVKFYGACLNPRKSFILTEYCPKGSLQDILENEQFQLDWMFRLSLMHDIVRGMQFLHSSDIKSHGNLKSSNCVVDSRFVLKITDFGLHTLRHIKTDKESYVENCNSHSYWSKLFWTAPELLKLENNRPSEGTQKGDVYSFGIMVHEITTRQGPFYLGKTENEKTPQEIIELVKGYPKLTRHPFRPWIDTSQTNADINSLMTKCWAEDPLERPDFNTLKSTIRKFNKDNETGNIVDNLLKRMEQYANNLEELVEERTQDYLEEKKKCEKLLYQLLPQSVAAQLISGQPVVAETFDQVTIYFSDIVGFTAISAESTPMQVVQFLNDLYTCFDSIVEHFDVYKVETIGDAYMVVSGLPIRNGNQHAREIARLALALLQAVHNFQIHHRPNDRLKLRIGLHTGACVAGVVGLKMPRYCLFGDTVNTASRMESNGEALKIHISEKTKLALDDFGTFITTQRGYVPMKGKGEMLTYWLEGEIPTPDSPIGRLPLSRRPSLNRQNNQQQQQQLTQHHNSPQRHCLYKQHSEISDYTQPSIASPPPYQLQIPSNTGRLSNQSSPNLRAKRKISSSSPKLNGTGLSHLANVAANNIIGNYGSVADYKTEDFNYLDLLKPHHTRHGLRARDSFTSANGAADIYSSRSLRESSKDNLELANFRLPLSGALKNHHHNQHNPHNANRNQYNQLLQSNSNSNISGILQPTSTKLHRLKTSPTISTLATCSRGTAEGNFAENVSLNSAGSRIKFNLKSNHHTSTQFEPPQNNQISTTNHQIINETQHLHAAGNDAEDDVDDNSDSDESICDNVQEAAENRGLIFNNHETTLNNISDSGSKNAVINKSSSSSKIQLLDNSNLNNSIQFCRNNSQNSNSNVNLNINNSSSTGNTNSNSTGSSINNYNNIVKANNVRNFKLLCKSPSNSPLVVTKNNDIEAGDSSNASGNSSVVSNSAVTQPLLAKINS